MESRTWARSGPKSYKVRHPLRFTSSLTLSIKFQQNMCQQNLVSTNHVFQQNVLARTGASSQQLTRTSVGRGLNRARQHGQDNKP